MNSFYNFFPLDEGDIQDNGGKNQGEEDEEYEVKMKPSKAEEKEKSKEAKMLDVDEEEERVSALDEVEDKLRQEEAHEQDISKGNPIGKIVGGDEYDNVKTF